MSTTNCASCYEPLYQGGDGLLLNDKREPICQSCADHIRAVAHEKLQVELEASREIEQLRFALRWINGICKRPLNLHDPRLQIIGVTCEEALGLRETNTLPCDVGMGS